MKKTVTTRGTVKPGDKRRSRTDWAAADPDARPLDAKRLAKMRRVSRVKALRERLEMTQTAFAEAFHLPVTTLRDWEQRRSVPDAPARALLLAIERDPMRMRELLSEKAR